MQTSHKMWLAGWMASVLVASISTFARTSFPGPQAPGSADVPILKGGAGPCTADFVVSDSSRKGIYDAKITTQIKYGFMGLHRLDLTVGTNFEGKARIEGLPEQIKGSADFKVSHVDQTKLVPYDPQANCHPRHEVILGEKQAHSPGSHPARTYCREVRSYGASRKDRDVAERPLHCFAMRRVVALSPESIRKSGPP